MPWPFAYSHQKAGKRMYVQGESSLSQIPFYFHLPARPTWTDWPAFSFATARFMISLSLSLSHTSIILWRKPWSSALSLLLVFIGVHVCVMRLYFNGWMERFVPCCSKGVGTEICNIFFFYVPVSRSLFFCFGWKGHVYWLHDFLFGLCQNRSHLRCVPLTHSRNV